MLIEDIEKLIKQLQEEQGMTQDEVRKEAFRRALEDMDNDFEVKRGFDRFLGGCPAPNFYELEGDVEWEDDGKPSESKGFFRRIIDKLVKWGISDDTEF